MLRTSLVAVSVLALTSAAVAQSAVRPESRSRTPSTLRIMNQRIPEVRFVEQPFEQVVEWLADFTEINIVVRWQQLADMGIQRDRPISMQVRNLRLSQVLWLLLNETGGSDVTLAYRASGNLLVISTEEDLGRELITRVYDVSDLLARVPQAPRPDFQTTEGLNQQAAGATGGGGGSGQSIFGQQQQQQRQQDDELQVEMDRLVELITNVVEPETWEVNGGGRGQIEPFKNLLIVTNTVLVHQRLGGYIDANDVVGP
jgi:hypothetical protein